MKSQLSLITLAVLFAAMPLQARESRHIHETVDPYSGTRTLSLEIDTHGCLDDHPLNRYSADVHLIVSAIATHPRQVAYILAPDLRSRHMKLYNAQQTTLDTSVDGIATQLGPGYPKTKHIERSGWSGRHVLEVVPFDVSFDYLTRLAQAQDFHFRVNTRTESIQRCADAHDLRELHEFLDAAAAY
jgi:hypothetical protein